MAKIEDTIAALEIKLKQAKALKQKVEARKRTLEQKADRATNTRRKILIGAFFLEKMEKNEDYKTKVLQQLVEYLKRSDDRALFGFETLPKNPQPAPNNGY